LKGHGFVIYDASHNICEIVNLVRIGIEHPLKYLKTRGFGMTRTASHSVKNSQGAPQCGIVSAFAKEGGPASASAADPMLASMQPDELRGAMDRLGYATQSSLAQAIGVDRSTVSLWLEGRIGVPRPVAKLVRLLLVHESTTGRVAP